MVAPVPCGARGTGTGLLGRADVAGGSRALVGAAAGLVAVLTVIGILGPWHNTPAFASWTAVPVAPSDTEAQARVDRCPQRYPTPEGTGRALEPVLLDVRGDYSFVILSDGALVMQCYLETVPETGAVLASTAQAGPLRHRLGEAALTTESNGVTTWGHGPRGGGAIALAFGRADDDATAVEASLSDGRVVTATVENGWWGMWAPGDLALPGTATVTHVDGSRASVVISQD